MTKGGDAEGRKETINAEKNFRMEKSLKKQIRQAVKRYKSGQNPNTAPGVFTFVGALGLAADLFVTGGVLTLSAATAGVLFLAGGLNLYKNGKSEYTNQHGQKYVANALIEKTLRTMQENIQSSFNAAAKPDSTAGQKHAFLALAEQVQEDAKTLSAVFQMKKSVPEASKTEEYTFTLINADKTNTTPGPHGGKEMLLSEAVREITSTLVPGTAPETGNLPPPMLVAKRLIL